MIRSVLVLAFAVSGCANTRDAAAGKVEVTADSVSGSVIGRTPADSTAQAVPAGNFSAELQKLRTDINAPIRGLYVNRFAAQSTRKMKRLIDVADSTEINAFVIDVKDEFGLNFRSDDPILQKNAGTQTKVANMKALVDTLNAHGILPIARIVVFKDSVAARMNPNSTIRRADGSIWRDHEGLAWVNPYANAIWDYNIRVAEEMARMGFGEIQFDYIRFPEPYKSLPPQVFPESNGRSKPQALSEFLKQAKTRIDNSVSARPQTYSGLPRRSAVRSKSDSAGSQWWRQSMSCCLWSTPRTTRVGHSESRDRTQLPMTSSTSRSRAGALAPRPLGSRVSA